MVVEETEAVLVIDPVAVGGAFTTNVNAALAPGAIVAAVQVSVPVPPAGGGTQENAGPAVCVDETKVVPVGTGSLSVTFEAAEGPALVTVTVYETFDPATTPLGPILVTPRSATWATVVVKESLLFDRSVSAPDVLTVAVFVAETALLAFTISVNWAFSPEAIAVNEQKIVPLAPTGGVTHAAVGPLP